MNRLEILIKFFAFLLFLTMGSFLLEWADHNYFNNNNNKILLILFFSALSVVTLFLVYCFMVVKSVK